MKIHVVNLLLILMIQCGGEAREFQQEHVDRLYQRLTALETKNQQLEARMEYLLTNDVAKKTKLPDSVVVTGNRSTFNIEQIREGHLQVSSKRLLTGLGFLLVH